MPVDEPHPVEDTPLAVAGAAPPVEPEVPRGAATLEGVLKYATAVGGGSAVADGEEEVKEMEPQKRNFLNEVLAQISSGQDSAMKEVTKLIEIVKDPSASVEDRCEALESLGDWVEDINVAVDFHTLGGFVPVVRVLRTGSSSHSVIGHAIRASGLVFHRPFDVQLTRGYTTAWDARYPCCPGKTPSFDGTRPR